MAKFDSFEDLEIWKEGMRLTLKVYNLMRNCKDYAFKDQIQRAAVSIPSNIAEGYERQTNKELIQFLYIAKGSCGEMRTQLYLANKLDYITKDDLTITMDEAKRLSSKIANFIKARKNING